MARIISILSILLVIIISLTAIVFALRNDQPVSVDFLFLEFSSISLGLWLLGSLLVGLLLGLLFSIPAQIYLSGSNKIKDKKLQTTQSKLSRLKRASAKG
jgi:uncharacterized integral membrane protein